ncbi:O-antigen polymerase [Mastigocoleus testarum BC008]|uniref:O-antigen polymerase n=2 Tax=Mastigocoleus TaxID=996924 RepID=A0A0V7ZCZ4_9CYAN|nr:O-antigen polymerase [Mastigocoleus testarum BC008]KST70287.1 O-antigen polymerase [Mastigocoleus testarum BC008]
MPQPTLDKVEKIIAVLGLLFFSGMFAQIAPTSVVSIVRYIVWLGPTVLMIFRHRSTRKIACRSKLLWVLIGILLLSFLWSDYLPSTLADNREVLQMSTFGLYFAARFDLRQQLKLIALSFAIGAVMSFIVALAVPEIGIHGADHPGAWKGVYGYKNNLGSMMILATLAFVFVPVRPIHRFLKWICLFMSIALILLSTSKTSLTMVFLLFLTLFFYRKYRWRGKVTVLFLDIGILLLGCVGTIVFAYWVDILAGLGKDPTLTGRTLMWGVTLTRLMDRPLLGYGRTAFWAPGSPYAVEAGRAVTENFVPPHAHNGFIDLALDVGLIGFALFTIIFFKTYFKSLQRAYAAVRPENLWYIAFLLFLFMNNIMESYLLYKSNIYWVLFVTTVLSV